MTLRLKSINNDQLQKIKQGLMHLNICRDFYTVCLEKKKRE